MPFAMRAAMGATNARLELNTRAFFDVCFDTRRTERPSPRVCYFITLAFARVASRALVFISFHRRLIDDVTSHGGFRV
jgi:hypothetical protein